MNRIYGVVVCALLLVGCGSSVKLDDVAVEDKSGKPVGVQPQTGAAGAGSGAVASGAGAGNIGNTGVAPVDLTKPGNQQQGAAIPQEQRLVYFDYDSFIIKPEFQSVIETNARILKADARRAVAIEGHTDETGGREYNLALGQKRAEAVRRALGLLGVADSQMEAVSFGKEKPAVQGSDESAWARNRRAEIVYR